MVNVIENAVRSNEIFDLIRFYLVEDRHVVYHPYRDYRMKMLDFYNKDLPKKLHDVVNRVIDYPYKVAEEVLIMHGSDFTSKLHVDSGPNRDRWGHVVLIPLQVPSSGDYGTVYFKNHYLKSDNDNPVFTYGKAPNNGAAWTIDGRAIFIRDMEALVPYMDTDGEFEYQGNKFIMDQTLRNKIKARIHPNKGGWTKNKTDDYPNITGYDPNYIIDQDTRSKWLAHHAPEDLVGLQIDKIIRWQIGDVILFDRTVVHTGSSTATGKIGITVVVDRE